MRNTLKISFAPALLLFACTTNPDVKTASASQALDGDNGISMNGISMNGISMNGISMNGISMNGISMNGTELIGARLQAALSNGDTLSLRVDDLTTLADDNTDVTAYTLSAELSTGWIPLCGYE